MIEVDKIVGTVGVEGCFARRCGRRVGGDVSDFKGFRSIMDVYVPALEVLLAEKSYDADFICDDMEKRGGMAMIPTKRNRRIQLPVDPAIYVLRNMVERCFTKLKNARWLANRYDRAADS